VRRVPRSLLVAAFLRRRPRHKPLLRQSGQRRLSLTYVPRQAIPSWPGYLDRKGWCCCTLSLIERVPFATSGLCAVRVPGCSISGVYDCCARLNHSRRRPPSLPVISLSSSVRFGIVCNGRNELTAGSQICSELSKVWLCHCAPMCAQGNSALNGPAVRFWGPSGDRRAQQWLARFSSTTAATTQSP
jgi:hypothetical protein